MQSQRKEALLAELLVDLPNSEMERARAVLKELLFKLSDVARRERRSAMQRPLRTACPLMQLCFSIWNSQGGSCDSRTRGARARCRPMRHGHRHGQRRR